MALQTRDNILEEKQLAIFVLLKHYCYIYVCNIPWSERLRNIANSIHHHARYLKKSLEILG